MKHPDPSSPLRDLIADFALSMRATGKSPKTIRTYSDAALWLAASVKASSWPEVSRSDVRTHLAAISAEHSPAYASNQFRALQQLFVYLADEGEIPASPMLKMKPPAVPQKLVPVVGKDTMGKLIATCDKSFTGLRDRAIFLLFASSCARLSEIAGLRVQDVFTDGQEAIVTGKAGKMRVIRFDAAAALALSRYLRARKSLGGFTEASLWIGQRGPVTPSGVYQMFIRRGRRAGVHIHPHQLRHTFSHRWLANGGNEGDLMELNGWSSASMLRRYGASAAAERARTAYDRVMGGAR